MYNFSTKVKMLEIRFFCFQINLILFHQTYYITKAESDSVAIIFVVQMLLM
jgi:hypothetical protein